MKSRLVSFLFVLFTALGALPHTLVAQSWSTSFNFYNIPSNGVTIITDSTLGMSVDTINYGTVWPDNIWQRKLNFNNSNADTGHVRKTASVSQTGYEQAWIQFMAPDGVSDHIVLGILSNDPGGSVSPSGYFIMLGNNHNRLGSGYRIGIEKATATANWIFPGTYPYGGAAFDFNPDAMYVLVIQAFYDAQEVDISAWIDEWVPGTGFITRASVEHVDNNDVYETDTTGNPEGVKEIQTGPHVFFGTFWQNYPVIWDQFSVSW
jgi:hypothetical protein